MRTEKWEGGRRVGFFIGWVEYCLEVAVFVVVNQREEGDDDNLGNEMATIARG